jgi:hypothetical protein
LVNNANFTLYGDVEDNGGLGRVDVCLEGDCAPAKLQLDPGRRAAIVEDDPGPGIAINNSTSCGGGEIIRTFDFTETFSVGDVHLGFFAQHDHRDDLQVTLVSPEGTAVQVLTDDGISGTDFLNANFWFNDAAPLSFKDDSGDHDPSSPLFEHYVRSDQPLVTFLGENTAGTWTLKVCDLNPGANNGTYLGSTLMLTPRDIYSKSGRWSHQMSMPVEGGLDYVTREITIYGQDVVGNRTDIPLTLDLVIDNVAPLITVTNVISEGLLGNTLMVLDGIVADGSPSTYLTVHVYPPAGEPYNALTVRDGDQWEFELPLTFLGTYNLWITASDVAGNTTTVGPFDVTVVPPTTSYIPLVMKNGLFAPDLVVENILVTANGVEIKITNIGNAPVRDAFWVDLYIDPHPTPTVVNQTWDQLSTQGLVWGVEDVSALVPRGSLTINLSHPSFRPDYSYFTGAFKIGVPIYVQVDSYAGTNYGAILERDEITAALYNNIAGPSYALPVTLNQGDSLNTAVTPPPSDTGLLPVRPY